VWSNAFYRNPRLTALFLGLVIVAGLAALQSLARQRLRAGRIVLEQPAHAANVEPSHPAQRLGLRRLGWRIRGISLVGSRRGFESGRELVDRRRKRKERSIGLRRGIITRFV